MASTFTRGVVKCDNINTKLFHNHANLRRKHNLIQVWLVQIRIRSIIDQYSRVFWLIIFKIFLFHKIQLLIGLSFLVLMK